MSRNYSVRRNEILNIQKLCEVFYRVQGQLLLNAMGDIYMKL